MGSRPTIADLAARAGVSVATVDRVLNGRQRVREETARRVYQAASEIGYYATALIRHRLAADLPQARLGFLLQRQDQSFYQAFAGELVKAAAETAGWRVQADLRFVAAQTPQEVCAALEALGAANQAVALTSLDHHSVTKVVENLKSNGKPVYALLSDFAQGVRENYVGTNNMKVGRTAAWLVAHTARRPGKVAVFVGSHRWHGHELRETGFRSYFREYAPQFEVLDTLINLETHQVTYEATLNLVHRHAGIAGLYIAGGGMEGALQALRELPPDRLPSVVVNELTPDSRAALQDRLVTAAISTPLPQLCRTLVDHMLATIRNGPAETPGQIFLPFGLSVPESI
ncbi:MAG: LacI family transcriptional regulator [Alphaproteobacteria bacterium]|nr:MAG: LacI family transcriptional regulator [Alphaproteobacteria bacterium]